MTKKVMSLLIVACVAMSMIGVTIGIVAYWKRLCHNKWLIFDEK